MKDGGPAFPTFPGEFATDGMSLRDYFAAKAMAAFIQENPMMNADHIAELAYVQAYWMLCERSKTEPK